MQRLCIFRMGLLAIFVLILWEFAPKLSDHVWLLRSMLAGMLVPLAMGIVQARGALRFVAEEGLRYGGGGQDLNYLAFMYSVSIVVAVYLAYRFSVIGPLSPLVLLGHGRPLRREFCLPAPAAASLALWRPASLRWSWAARRAPHHHDPPASGLAAWRFCPDPLCRARSADQSRNIGGGGAVRWRKTRGCIFGKWAWPLSGKTRYLELGPGPSRRQRHPRVRKCTWRTTPISPRLWNWDS